MRNGPAAAAGPFLSPWVRSTDLAPRGEEWRLCFPEPSKATGCFQGAPRAGYVRPPIGGSEAGNWRHPVPHSCPNVGEGASNHAGRGALATRKPAWLRSLVDACCRALLGSAWLGKPTLYQLSYARKAQRVTVSGRSADTTEERYRSRSAEANAAVPSNSSNVTAQGAGRRSWSVLIVRQLGRGSQRRGW
jgi:hypothetical protein